MKVKDLLNLVKYKNIVIRVNIDDDYFEYSKKNADLFSDTILNATVSEIVPLEGHLEIYGLLSE